MGDHLESRLEPGEHIIYRTRKHRLPALLMAALFLAGLFIIKYYHLYGKDYAGDAINWFVVFALIVLTSGIFLVIFLLEYFKTVLALTNRRVIGVYKFKHMDIPLAQIESATVDRTSGLSYDVSGSMLGAVAVWFGLIFMNPFVYQLIGMGNVRIVDKEGNTTHLKRLYLPDQFTKEIQELIPAIKAASTLPAFKFNWIMGVGIGLFVVSILALVLLIWIYKPATMGKTSVKTTVQSKETAPKPAAKPVEPAPQLTARDYFNKALEAKDIPQQISFYTKAVELDPNFTLAYYSRGNAYHQNNDYENALRDYNRAIELDSNFVFCYNNRGMIYFAKKEYKKAFSDYNKAISLKPDNHNVYYNRGRLYYNLKDYELALNDFNKAISLKPDYAFAYFMRAVLHNQMGNFEQARDDYNKAKTLNPKIPDFDIKSPN